MAHIRKSGQNVTKKRKKSSKDDETVKFSKKIDRKGGTGWRKINTMKENRELLLKHIDDKVKYKGYTRREAILTTASSLQLIVNINTDEETDKRMQKDIEWLRKMGHEFDEK